MTERPKRVVLRISVFSVPGSWRSRSGCDKLLDLLGAPARPLGDNRHLRIRHIRKCVDRRMDKAGDTGDYGDRGTEEDKEFVPEGERYDIIYECMHIVWLL